MSSYDGEEIVISGIGGHFPECDNMDEFKDKLLSGVDMVTEMRPRWEPGELNVPVKIGKMTSLEKCDAQYFGLIGKQCHALDPITRKVLERTYEAIFDAGFSPSDFAGSKTAVFFGTSILETEMSLMEAKSSNAYNILGRNKTMNANRVSYWLDLKGPSFALDSTWSSGLQTFSLGYQYIKSGICDSAFVVAGSSIIHPHFSKHLADLKLLSPDGYTRSFDEAANGCARSEAVVVLLLQRLKNCKKNYGIIVNSVCNSMPAPMMIKPQKEMWLQLFREFYEECRVDPNEVVFLEAYGLACLEADAEELNAVNEFFCHDRNASNPLLVGSVKTNIGHTMAASGLCSIAKVLIANQSGKIPPNLHYGQPNKLIPGLLTGEMKVVTKPTELEGDLLAINDFGFGGTYGHCLIRRPHRKTPTSDVPQDGIPRLVLLSGRNEEGLSKVMKTVEQFQYSYGSVKLVHDIFSRNIAYHMYRGYTVLPDGRTRFSEPFEGAKRPVWFIFSGMGSHWPTMGKDLKRLPVFKESIDACHKILQKKGLDLWDILTKDDNKMFDNIINSFVSISSTQIALVDILRRLGIEPDGIIGHSAGELGAAYADGSLTREEMILSSYFRGKVSYELKVIKGMMAAVGKGYTDLKDCLPDDVEVACHNSSSNCTISGPREKVLEFCDKLKKDGIFVKAVNVSEIAFHSKHIKDFGPKLKEELSRVILNPKKRSSKWVSSSVPEHRWHEQQWNECSAEYLTNNLLSPVYFEEACRHIPKNAIVIEIAPHSLLLSILKRSLPRDCINVGLLHRDASDQLLHLFQSIGKLYTSGMNPKVSALFSDVTFPVPLETPFLGTLATWDHSFSWNSKVPINRINTKNSQQVVLDLEETNLYKSFKYEDELVLPYAVLLMLVLELFSSSKDKKLSELSMTLEEVFFLKPIKIDKMRNLQFMITNLCGTGSFELLLEKEAIMTGKIMENPENSRKQDNNIYLDAVKNPFVTMDENEVYSLLMQLGYQYRDALRNIKRIHSSGSAWEIFVEWNENLIVLIESLIQCHIIATYDSDHSQEVKFIRELTIEPDLLANTNLESRFTLNTKTGVMAGPGITLKELKFKLRELAPLPVNGKITSIGPRICGQLKVSYLEYFGGNVKSNQMSYSGSSSDLNVMGICSYDNKSLSLLPDDILSWIIPDKWRLEDAATIPLPYTLAYYMLEFIAGIKGDSTVFISNALSNVGLASVAVSLSRTNQIWVTVESDEEKRLLLNRFQELKDNVFVIEPGCADNVLPLIDIKKKDGAYVIINTRPGRELEKYLRRMDSFGHVFHVFLEDTQENDLLYGTETLTKSGSIYGITLRNILSADAYDKGKVKEMLCEGIRSGVVNPLPQRVVKQGKLRQNSNRLTKKTEVICVENYDGPTRFMCKSYNSYLIICCQIQTGLQMAEWFAKRHAKKISLIHSDRNITNSSEVKISILKQSISLTVKEVDTFDEINLKRTVTDLVNVNAAVVLPVDEDDNKDSSYGILKFLKNLDPKSHLVCVLKPTSNALDICQERSRNGMPTSVLLWNKRINGKTRQLVKVLDKLLSENTDIIYHVNGGDDVTINIEKDIGELLMSLPKCEDEIARYGKEMSEEVVIKEIRTLSVPYDHMKEALPVFLLGGIKTGRSLTEKFRNSIYPTFHIELPHFGRSSVEELASYAVPKLKSIAHGPYIIIGEQWGGCIALELGSQLEKLGDQVHVFLLSGTPAEVIEPLRYIASTDEPLEVSLISRLLQIKDPKLLQELSNQNNWSAKINYCTQVFKEGLRDNVLKGLDAIKWRLEALLPYSMKTPLNGPLTIVTKKQLSPENYTHLCRTRVALHEVNEEDVLNDSIFRMIHDTALHKTL